MRHALAIILLCSLVPFRAYSQSRPLYGIKVAPDSEQQCKEKYSRKLYPYEGVHDKLGQPVASLSAYLDSRVRDGDEIKLEHIVPLRLRLIGLSVVTGSLKDAVILLESHWN